MRVSQGFGGTKENIVGNVNQFYATLRRLSNTVSVVLILGEVVSRYVKQGTNKEKLWEHRNTGILEGSKNPPGRPLGFTRSTKRKTYLSSVGNQ